MTQRHHDMPAPSSQNFLFLFKPTEPLRRLSSLAAATILMLATLACGFFDTGSSVSISHINRLPTLTRTPLPTLTSTSVVPAIAATPSAEPAAPSVPNNPTVAVVAAEAAPINIPVESVSPAPAAASTDHPVEAPSVAPLPTDTPTPMPIPTDTPLPTATTTPLPTDTPTPTITPTPQVWVFNGVRLSPNPYNDGLLMYGNLVNNTGTAQKLTSVLGTFYDAQNQVIAGPDSSESYSPAYVVAPGAGVPFELAVETIDNAANFNLNVAAEPSDEVPRQDFEFSDIEQWADEGLYCISGELKNHSGQLHDYLVIALILYDGQENVISFSYYEELDPDWIEGDDQLDFELCSDVLEQGVARHELQAWGR
ncbi:MAG: hypothetical protein KJ077_40610 [Anaerolineae bacterium]|nr:hypothetical protein [Anaerolineae bacterium]